MLADEAIDAPLMIVKGDGSLMKAEIALEYPVETILSGPAASVVGAGFLTGLEDFVVSDMGGTTTDIAVVSGGRPVISDEGALVGAWRTMVEAVDVRTSGLGGDSEVCFDRQLRLRVGPRKAMPLSLMAHSFPAALALLRSIAELERLPPYADAICIPQSRSRAARAFLGARAPRVGRAGFGAAAACRASCAAAPVWRRCVGSPMPGSPPLPHSRRAMPCTCWTGSMVGAARPPSAARAFSPPRNTTRAPRVRRLPPRQISERTVEHVVRETGRMLLAAALAHDPA